MTLTWPNRGRTFAALALALAATLVTTGGPAPAVIPPNPLDRHRLMPQQHRPGLHRGRRRRLRLIRRVGSLIVAAVVTVGLSLTSTPAQAGAVPAAVAFIGRLYVVPALGYPVVAAPGNGSWAFAIDTGIGVATTSPPDFAFGVLQGGSIGAGDVQSFVADTVGPPLDNLDDGAYCGLSRGWNGAGHIDIGTARLALTDVGWTQSAGTLIVLTNQNGTVSGSTFIGVLNAIPPVAGVTSFGSCLAGTANEFIVVGTAVSTG